MPALRRKEEPLGGRDVAVIVDKLGSVFLGIAAYLAHRGFDAVFFALRPFLLIEHGWLLLELTVLVLADGADGDGDPSRWVASSS